MMRKITLSRVSENFENIAKDKLALPFEVEYSEMPSKKSRTMKRLALVVKPENVDGIIASLKESGLEATIYDVKGAGKDKERVSSGRGSGAVVMISPVDDLVRL